MGLRDDLGKSLFNVKILIIMTILDRSGGLPCLKYWLFLFVLFLPKILSIFPAYLTG